MSNNNMPSIVIAGTQKSGTTSLFDWLGQHPDIYANPSVKDYPYFTSNELYKHERQQFAKMLLSPKKKRVKEVLYGDANLIYIPKAVERLAQLSPHAKVIVVLRNPVKRAVSAWKYARERCMEDRSFLCAIQQEMDGVLFPLDKYEGRQKNYIAHGLYSQQVRFLQKHMKKEQIKVVLYEDLVLNSKVVTQDIFQFIGVDNSFQPEFSTKNKTLGGSRFQALSKLIYQPRSRDHAGWGTLRRVMPKSVRTYCREVLVKFNRVPKKDENVVKTESVKLLGEYYKEEINALEHILNRKLDIWR